MTRRRKQNIKLALVCAILGAIVLMTIFAPWLAPYDPLEVNMELRLLDPCRAHPLGTDALGRDVLSRVIYGGRASLLLAVVAAVMLLLSYVQLTTLAADTVALKSELTVLQAENVSLTAQHEQMFDMATVKEVAAAAGMSKPTSSQITYLDLDSEDSAVVYRTETPSVFSRILSSLHHGVYAVVEYFD